MGYIRWGTIGTLILLGIAAIAVAVANAMHFSTPIEQMDLSHLDQRLFLLELALVPQTPEEAAQRWAEGIKMRNGALQFAILAPALRQSLEAQYANRYWVTGGSSPWVESYTINQTAASEDSVQFAIRYQLMSSTGSAGIATDTITVGQMQTDDRPQPGWYITALQSSMDWQLSLAPLSSKSRH
ncbi:hypothetical protein IQ268_17160 [Oculatella sp. LEGE 06141]|uniref:hypothetical protein n=1 Tax=Oculatella sp. LEGE 06141 TaxID=1828648 RepID=UPI001881C614|nr:hypothetical protein [Oculatella sp. LEGE 06141]MBE9180293.1 hypothetical protein [Oculatella sp. LEGE 06141]